MAQSPYAFDKASWHLPEVLKLGLPPHQAYVHTGLLFAWLWARGLTQPWLEEQMPGAFIALRRGDLTGPAVFARWDGALLDDMLTDEGLAFAMAYIDPKRGRFIEDYRATLTTDLSSDYQVPDSPEAYQRLASVLDGRLAAWRTGYLPGPRLNPRTEPPPRSPPALPKHLSPPPLPVQGVPFPGAAIAARLRSHGALAAVRDALESDELLVLLPEGAADVGVIAWIAACHEEAPALFRVSLSCLARCERAAQSGWRVHTDPTGSFSDFDEVRVLASRLYAKRRGANQEAGLLALAVPQSGGAMLDLIARGLPLKGIEALAALETFDPERRAALIHDALKAALLEGAN